MKPRKPFKGFSYNCVVNRKPSAVGFALRDIKQNHGPFKFGVLQESNQYDGEISSSFPDYREIAYRKRGHKKDRNTRLLIKKKWYERLEVDFIICDEHWEGPLGGMQPGRIFPVGILGRGKQRLVIIGIHLAWNGDGSNGEAAIEERRALNNYIRSLPTTYSILAPGDWNRGEKTVADYISVSGWDVLPGTNLGVDHTGQRDVIGNALHGPHYGSDHPLQLIEARCV